MTLYTHKKFFKHLDFPTPVKSAFVEYASTSLIGYTNGSCILWSIRQCGDSSSQSKQEIIDDYIEVFGDIRGNQLFTIDEFLIDNDCVDGEEVVIHFNW